MVCVTCVLVINTQTVFYLFNCPVNAIIFLAPLSGFNQVLDEDEDVNRLVRCLT
jgi:hypothetical protein